MITSAQRERLLGQVVSGVELETAIEARGFSLLDLQMRLLCDEELDISLALALGMRTEFAKALHRALVSS